MQRRGRQIDSTDYDTRCGLCKNTELMTRMMIKKRPPADPLLRRSNRAELRRPLSTLGRLYKVFALCFIPSFLYELFLRLGSSARRRPVCIIYLCSCPDEPAVELSFLLPGLVVSLRILRGSFLGLCLRFGGLWRVAPVLALFSGLLVVARLGGWLWRWI